MLIFAPQATSLAATSTAATTQLHPQPNRAHSMPFSKAPLPHPLRSFSRRERIRTTRISSRRIEEELGSRDKILSNPEEGEEESGLRDRPLTTCLQGKRATFYSAEEVKTRRLATIPEWGPQATKTLLYSRFPPLLTTLLQGEEGRSGHLRTKMAEKEEEEEGTI